MENLVKYKESEHKFVYGWFDNSEKFPQSRGQHLTDLPDSLDVVVLMYPDNLVERELREIETIRNDKNTKVIYPINFDDMKVIFNKKINVESGAEPNSQDFLSYMVDSLQYALSIIDKYNYDGISIGYKGKDINHLTEAEKIEYKQNEKAFVGILNDWFQRHMNYFIVFEGNPQNLLERDLLTNCSMIFVPCLSSDSPEKLTFNFQLAVVENVPLDKLGVIIPTVSPDKTDKEIGYFADGTKMLVGVVDWALGASNTVVSGIGVYNISNDYYNPSLIFKDTKNLITSLNPSIKN